jgi:hypothetical protein
LAVSDATAYPTATDRIVNSNTARNMTEQSSTPSKDSRFGTTATTSAPEKQKMGVKQRKDKPKNAQTVDTPLHRQIASYTAKKKKTPKKRKTDATTSTSTTATSKKKPKNNTAAVTEEHTPSQNSLESTGTPTTDTVAKLSKEEIMER